MKEGRGGREGSVIHMKSLCVSKLLTVYTACVTSNVCCCIFVTMVVSRSWCVGVEVT